MSDDVRASGGEPARDLAPSERLRLIARAVKGLFYERDGVSGRMVRSLGQEDSLSGIASTLDEWISLVVEEDRPRLAEAMRAAKERGESYETEYRLRHPDGRLLHVRDRAVVQGAGARRPARIVGFLTDVTAQRLAEARARASEELRVHSERRYRLLAENSSDVIWTLDLRSGCFTYVSPSIERLRGLTVTEALAEPIEAALTPPSLARLRETIVRIASGKTGGPTVGIFDQPCKDGSVKHVEITASLIRDAAGVPVELLGVSRDATERVRAEAALRESEELYRELFTLIPSGVVLLDEAGRFLAFNHQAHRQLGYTRDEFARLSIADVDVRERGGAEEQHPRHVTSAGGEEFEALHRTQAGELRNVLVSSRPVEMGGRGRFLAVWTDVTARRQGEHALRERKQDLAVMAQVALDGFATTDGTGAFMEANPAFCQMVGYARSELLGMRISDLEEVESEPEVAARMRRIRAGAAERFETRYRRKDGGSVDAEASVRFVDVEGGRYLAFVRDVTERKRAELALRESERRLATIFQVAHAGIVLVRRSDGRILDANDAWLRQMGWERAEVIGRTTLELGIYVHPEQRDRFYQEYDAAGFVALMEVRVRRKSGEEGDFLLSTGGDGEVGGERCAVGVWHDVGALRRADERHRHSEARFRALIERAADIIALLDAEGRVTFLSPNATETLGWTAQDLEGRLGLDLVHPDDRAEAARALSRLLESPGATVRQAMRQQQKDGAWRWMDVSARNLLHDPAVAGVVLNSRDVTEQRQLEEQYRHAQKMEAIGRLAGGVAHDFNNLLTVILSSSESLLRDRQAGVPVDPEDITQVHEAGERARDLTRQLLAFARKQVVAPLSLDLNAVVLGSEKLLRRLLGEDVILEVRTQPGLWATLCDPGQVEQVLVNLAVNARDAMPRGGTLTLETRNVAVDLHPAALDPDRRAGEWVRLVVRDTGVGMAPDVQAHLFEPFFTTKEPGRGTGLGLATVHGIVTQSGGHVHVDSQPGHGTTFEICLPRTRITPAAPGALPPDAVDRGEGKETVLVVEDDPQVRGVTARALERAGYKVLVATEGAEALDIAARPGVHFDLVVTDVVMPGMGGPAVVEALRARHPGLRALYVSGYTQDAAIQRGVLDSGFHFLAKPFTAAALRARVRAVLDQ